MTMVNVYQLDDFAHYDPAMRYPMSRYYHAARIPEQELLHRDTASIAEYLVLASYSPVWHDKKMGPMRAGDLLVFTEGRKLVKRAYILAHDGSIRLPKFTTLSLNEYEISQEEFDTDERPYLAISHF